nr:transglycosylase domain-containing protein [Nocardia stercoris]
MPYRPDETQRAGGPAPRGPGGMPPRGPQGGDPRGPQGGDRRGPQGGDPRGPQGGDRRGPQGDYPRRPQGDYPRGPQGDPQRRPAPRPGDTGAQSNMPMDDSTRRVMGSLSEAVAQRGQRPGGRPGDPSRPGDPNRPGAGSRPATGSQRAVGPGQRVGGPPNRPPNGRRGTGGGGGDGRGPAWLRNFKWKYVRRAAYVFFALLIIIPSTVFLVAYNTVSVPRPGDLKNSQTATVLAADNTTVISKIVPPQGNRTDVTIDQIPPHVRNAVIAAEDRSFYTNPGFSVGGFARAFRDNLLGKESAGGGSTITQQYVKNAMVGNEHSLTRKMHELVISAKMARSWSKDDILVAYLNTIPFGRGSFGIDAAAHVYFNKKVQDLTVEEGAMLAATIQQPYGLDPEHNLKGAQERWNYVLDGMVSMGNLPSADRAKMQYPEVRSSADVDNEPGSGTGPEGHIKTQVMNELSAAGITDTQISTLGLQITTTIDPQAQQAALDAVHKYSDGEREDNRYAVVSIDPKTGGVKAYYGGENGVGLDYANSPEQTGSTAKVWGLATNLELGKPLSEMYDSSTVNDHGIQITNVEGEGCGTCTIAQALKMSLNTSFIRMEMAMQPANSGAQKIADMAHKLGIPETIPGMEGKTLQNADGGVNDGVVLGEYTVRPIDIASTYATIANSGMYHAVHFVQKVVAADGQVLLDRGTPTGEQRVSAAVADNVIDAMRPIAGWSNHHDLAGGRPSGAKTGTTQYGTGGDAGADQDAWMIGFTPSLATAVWIGHDTPAPLKTASGGPMYGSQLPSDIWKATMDGALKGTPVEQFPKPAAIAGQAGVPSWSTPYTPPATQNPLVPQFVPSMVPGPPGPFGLPGVPQVTMVPNPAWTPAPAPDPNQPSGPAPGQPMATTDPAAPGAAPGGNPAAGTPPGNRNGR